MFDVAVMAALKDIVAKRKTLLPQARCLSPATSTLFTTAGFLDDILGSVCKPGQWKVSLRAMHS